jgi:hypothetical protein
MSDQQQHMPWREGLPTKPDVDALLAAFPPDTIKPGEWRKTDAEISAVIPSAEGVRLKTITNTWRKRLMRDYNVNMFRQESVGFFCPTPDEVFAKTHPTYEHVGRSIGKQMRHVAIVKPENEGQRVTQEHQGRLLYATKRVLRKDRMNVLPSTATAEQPKIEPPKQANKT